MPANLTPLGVPLDDLEPFQRYVFMLTTEEIHGEFWEFYCARPGRPMCLIVYDENARKAKTISRRHLMSIRKLKKRRR
jgi:hypothetical protein